MLTLIQNAEVYAPERLGKRDVLLAGGRIAAVQEEIRLEGSVPIHRVNGEGGCLLPGFIDPHVHIAGGGGEGGFRSRTPEICLTDLTTAGVTTVIGTLGTDNTTRSPAGLLAKANALEEEGITTFVQIGSYHLPLRTITGSVTDDIILIQKAVGIGEIAVADHRSSHPTVEELARLASEVRLGGMLSGKAGTVNLHMGDSVAMLELVEAVLAGTEIPLRHFVPTHMNRNRYLFGKAGEYLRRGGWVDFTTSTTPVFLEEGEIAAGRTLRLLEEQGISTQGVTFSSDGQGSLPLFDEEGNLCGIGVGRVSTLYGAVREAVLEDGMPLERALPVITANTAAVYQLLGKGRIETDADADLVLVDGETLEIQSVWAMGTEMVRDGQAVVKGTFER